MVESSWQCWRGDNGLNSTPRQMDEWAVQLKEPYPNPSAHGVPHGIGTLATTSGSGGGGSLRIRMSGVVIKEDHWLPRMPQQDFPPNLGEPGPSHEGQSAQSVSPVSYLAQIIQDMVQGYNDQ